MAVVFVTLNISGLGEDWDTTKIKGFRTMGVQ